MFPLILTVGLGNWIGDTMISIKDFWYKCESQSVGFNVNPKP